MTERTTQGAGVTTAMVRKKLSARGLVLPRPWRLPAGLGVTARLVRVVGEFVFVSGHIPLDDDGRVAGPPGIVGTDLDIGAAQHAAIRAALGILASLDAELGDLTRIGSWCRLNGMVRANVTFNDFPSVFNPVSQLLVDLFGPQVGAHSRVAVGVAGLPWDMPVEIEAQLLLRTP